MNSDANSGKKAVHVKWAGKTIALGTFPALEADEKCARAKALTRAWRSTMRPKPTREWVMTELERLGVRVVSGRLGRKEGDELMSPENGESVVPGQSQPPGIANDSRINTGTGIAAEPNLAGILQTAARRNSSIGLSMLSDVRRNSLGSLGPLFPNADPTDALIPPHRPYKGGGAAAAYEAAFHDHYLRKSEEQQRRVSSLGLGGISSGPIGGVGGVNPDQHYEMLKLHHMNLLNEIQETTLMMNLYQQQQLQQQQQQLQQQASAQSLTPGGPHGTLEQILNSAQLTQQQRVSLGLGGSQFGLGALSAQNYQIQNGSQNTNPLIDASQNERNRVSESSRKRPNDDDEEDDDDVDLNTIKRRNKGDEEVAK